MVDKEPGKLYVVAVPIGNLGDITFRAVDTLKSVNFIAAEDTRTSSILLRHYGISKPLLSFHSYSTEKRLEEIVNKIVDGQNAALITDAGTPGISDPGYVLVNRALQKGCDVVPIPGATALIAALSASGLRSDRFVFEGFLPLKKGRQKKLALLAEEPRTIVLYESTHRIERTLEELKNAFGDRKCVVARELTKIYETFYRGTISTVIASLKADVKKGEFVIIIEGKEN